MHPRRSRRHRECGGRPRRRSDARKPQPPSSRRPSNGLPDRASSRGLPLFGTRSWDLLWEPMIALTVYRKARRVYWRQRTQQEVTHERRQRNLRGWDPALHPHLPGPLLLRPARVGHLRRTLGPHDNEPGPEPARRGLGSLARRKPPCKHFSTLRPSGSAGQHGGYAALSACQPFVFAELLTSEGVSLSVLKCSKFSRTRGVGPRGTNASRWDGRVGRSR